MLIMALKLCFILLASGFTLVLGDIPTIKEALVGSTPLIEDVATDALIAPVAKLSSPKTAAQYWRRGGRRTPARYPDPKAPIDSSFAFARIQYTSVRGEPLGTGWTTDYPEGDVNFMRRFEEFTTSPLTWDGSYPNHVVVTLYDEELFKYPFIFMSDVGTVGLDKRPN